MRQRHECIPVEVQHHEPNLYAELARSSSVCPLTVGTYQWASTRAISLRLEIEWDFDAARHRNAVALRRLEAPTAHGIAGSAIQVTAEDLVAYAAVTDFPEDPSDRQANFDVDEKTLRDLVHACPQ